MRRLTTFATTAALAGGLLALPGTASAAPAAPAATRAVAAHTAEAAQRPKAHVTVNYPRAIRRGGFATFGYQVSGLRRLRGDRLVLVAYLPKGTASKIRFIARPPHSSCGVRDVRAYCVVRFGSADKVAMRLRVWVKYKYAGNYRVGHYARIVAAGSGSVRGYLAQVTRGDLIGTSRTVISRR
ncbi:hypothetical protein Sru01_10400 [Sphaerisporangium rufum]|uniref:Uncharacterized protein n=1 Tax=Sphaerisporangium rufum TaxID=1381558 RepID=A0A919QZ87_9ACTN|nr:hypothetical protein [Sphaerisporangium rufum]GII76058.1 hypothetical protein Sru01_10400 [Sphaerisporangium rufum]